MSLTFHANGRIEGTGSTTPYVVGSICQSKKFSITAPSVINNGIRSQSYPSGIKCSITPISTNPKILGFVDIGVIEHLIPDGYD